MPDLKWSQPVVIPFSAAKHDTARMQTSQVASTTPSQTTSLGRSIHFVSIKSDSSSSTLFTVNEKLVDQSKGRNGHSQIGLAKMIITSNTAVSTYLILGSPDASTYSCDIPFPISTTIKSVSISIDETPFVETCQSASDTTLQNIKWSTPRSILFSPTYTAHKGTSQETIRDDGGLYLIGKAI